MSDEYELRIKKKNVVVHVHKTSGKDSEWELVFEGAAILEALERSRIPGSTISLWSESDDIGGSIAFKLLQTVAKKFESEDVETIYPSTAKLVGRVKVAMRQLNGIFIDW